MQISDVEKLIPDLGQRPHIEETLADSNSATFPHARSKHVFAPPAMSATENEYHTSVQEFGGQRALGMLESQAKSTPTSVYRRSLSTADSHTGPQCDLVMKPRGFAADTTSHHRMEQNVGTRRLNDWPNSMTEDGRCLYNNPNEGISMSLLNTHAPVWEHTGSWSGPVMQSNLDLDTRSLDPLELILNSYADAEPMNWANVIPMDMQ